MDDRPHLPRVVRIDPATNAIGRRIKVGQRPFGLAYGAKSLWVSDRNLNRLSRINPRTGRVQARIKIGFSSYGLAFGAGSVWTSSESDGTIRRINPKRNRVSAKIKAGSQPNGVVYAFGAIWVADLGGGSVLKIDVRRNKVVARYAVPQADWITPSADALWVSGESNVIVELDPATGAVLAQIPVGHNPLASAWVRGELWVPNIDDGTISVTRSARAEPRSLRARHPPPRAAPARRRGLRPARRPSRSPSPRPSP